MTHWAAQYIGLPYRQDGEGPARGAEGGTPDRESWSFNCWSLFRVVQARHYGRTVPVIADPGTAVGRARLFRRHPELRRWRRVSRPRDGDGVKMTCAESPLHVGVWLDVDGGGVLHCREEGVTFQSPRLLRVSGVRIEGFYRFGPSGR